MSTRNRLEHNREAIAKKLRKARWIRFSVMGLLCSLLCFYIGKMPHSFSGVVEALIVGFAVYLVLRAASFIYTVTCTKIEDMGYALKSITKEIDKLDEEW